MEGEEVCRYHKFGYCKYKNDCKKRHFKEECIDLAACKTIKICMKRHPKSCTKYAMGQCRHENDCDYKHKDPVKNTEHNQMAEKLKQLEKVVHALTRKVLSLEEELTEIRKNKTKDEHLKLPCLCKNSGEKEHEDLKENVVEVKEDISEKDFNPKSSSSPKEKKNHPKNEVKKIKSIEDLYKCTKCEYRCKKEATLKKHMLTQHQDHACKECKEIFSSFMELLKHVADQHFKEQNEVENIEAHGEVSEIEKDIKEGGKDQPFVFSESMLDEFLV
jgi:hypothetical protein